MHRTPVFNEPAILGSRNRPRSLSEIIGGYRFNEIFAIQGGYIDSGEFGQDDVEASLEQRLGEDVTIKEYEPERGLTGKLRGGAQQVAFALGAGIASVADGDIEGLSFRR